MKIAFLETQREVIFNPDTLGAQKCKVGPEHTETKNEDTTGEVIPDSSPKCTSRSFRFLILTLTVSKV